MRNVFVDKDHRAIADLVQYDLVPGWAITRINVPAEHRGHGVGSKLLRQILDEADREGVDLYLEVSPSDGLDFEQLSAWYARHGFKWSRKYPGLMYRKNNQPTS
jgi:GNAT superfamily N-acetyltransferase